MAAAVVPACNPTPDLTPAANVHASAEDSEQSEDDDQLGLSPLRPQDSDDASDVGFPDDDCFDEPDDQMDADDFPW